MTSLLQKAEHLFGINTVEAVEHFAESEFDKGIAAAKTTEIGAAAIAAVKTVEDPALSGAEKMAKAVAIVAPVVLSYAAKGGFGGVLADAESFARSLLESTLADVRQTKALGIAQAVLAVAKAA